MDSDLRTSRMRMLGAESRKVAVGAAAAIGLTALALAIALCLIPGNEALIVTTTFVTFSAAIAIAIVTFVPKSAAPRIFFHPLVGPLAYLTYALILPLVYMAVTGRGIQVMPATMFSGANVAVMSLSVMGYVVGVAFGLWFLSDHRSARRGLYATNEFPDPAMVSSRFWLFTLAGRVALCVAFAAKLFQLATEGPAFARQYGEDQLSYELGTAIATVAGSLVAVGCLLIMYGNTTRGFGPLRTFDWVLVLALVGTSTILLGARSEVIAPVLLYFWFRLRKAKRVRLVFLLVAFVGLAGAFVGMARLRVKEFGDNSYPLVENLLVETSSPLFLTANVAEIVPSQVDFFGGSTYLEALKFMLPGPLSRALFGDPSNAGAGAYRDLVGYTNASQGWGFSIPTEAYLNFSYVGVIAVALALGLLLGVAYRWAIQREGEGRLSSFVYPLLISYLPFGLRSDALGQLKSTVYPLLIIGAVLLMAKLVDSWVHRNPFVLDSRWTRNLLPGRSARDS